MSRTAGSNRRRSTTRRPPTADTASPALASPKSHLVGAGLALLVSLLVYSITLAPTVTLVDSGELIVAARSLGVAHPPGFPLYVLLAHLATLLPIGNVAVRVNLASAVCAALAVAVVALLCAEMLRGTDAQSAAAKTPPSRSKNADQREIGSGRLWLPAIVAALSLAFSHTLWSYATVAEVYTLNTLLIAIVFLLVFRWRCDVAISPNLTTDRQLYVAAFLFGLALGVHHVTVGLTLPAIALLVYRTRPRAFRSKVILFAALWAFAGLTIYAYLPIAAARGPLLNWGDPRTLQRFWWHITGRQFQSYFSLSPGSIGSQLATFADLAVREFGPPWLPAALALAVAGFCALFRRDRTIFWFLLLVIAADLMYASTYEIAEDKAAYFLPAFLAIVLAAGCGARLLIEVADAARFRHAAQVTGATLLLVLVVALAGNFRVNDRHRDFIAHDYVDNILATIQPGGMLLTLDWQVYSPMLYVRAIERARRDAVVIDLNLLRRSWYFDYLEREYPRLMEETRAEVAAFLEDLRHWEQDPELYQRDHALNERIDTRFTSMIVAFIAAQLRAAPVYVTQDVLLSAEGQNSRLTKAITSAYQLVPQGLVFQLFADRVFHEPAAPQLRTRGLVDGTLQFAPDDVVLLKVLPVYVAMPYNRGRYLAANGRHEEAIAAFRQALAFNQGFALAQRALAESLKAAHASDGPIFRN
jgi:tetratricopeptide (TPR) repeat protein